MRSSLTMKQMGLVSMRVLEYYMMRSDLQHSCEEVATALKRIGEETTICLAEVTHCMLHS